MKKKKKKEGNSLRHLTSVFRFPYQIVTGLLCASDSKGLLYASVHLILKCLSWGEHIPKGTVQDG